MAWTLPADRLPAPSPEAEYLVTIEMGWRRPAELALARYVPTPGAGDLQGYWKHAAYPRLHIPTAAVLAWMPAPAVYEPAMALATKEGAA